MTRRMAAQFDDGPKIEGLQREDYRLQRRPAPQTQAGGGCISGTAIADMRSLTNSGQLDFLFRYIFANDPSFSYDEAAGTSPNRAKFLTISEPGFYMLDAVAYWDTNFTSGDNPYIQPTVWYPSSSTIDVLVNSDGLEAWDDTQDGVWGIELGSGNLAYHSLRNLFRFNYDPDNGSSTWAGEDFIGLGVRLNTSISRTKFFGANLHVTRLGEVVEQMTIT